MTPRPIHRWKTFWFGLLTLIFLLWIWDESYSHLATLSLTLPAGQLQLAYTEGVTFIAASEKTWMTFSGTRPVVWDYQVGSWAILVTGWERLNIPFISLSPATPFLAYLALWGSLLTWRWRHMKRLAIPPAQAHP